MNDEHRRLGHGRLLLAGITLLDDDPIGMKSVLARKQWGDGKPLLYGGGTATRRVQPLEHGKLIVWSAVNDQLQPARSMLVADLSILATFTFDKSYPTRNAKTRGKRKGVPCNLFSLQCRS
jgi:hypothetical protein